MLLRQDSTMESGLADAATQHIDKKRKTLTGKTSTGKNANASDATSTATAKGQTRSTNAACQAFPVTW